MADRYWVGGTGNWSDTAHWSDSSGGSSGFSVPTASDNVFFDAASHTTDYIVTIDISSFCNNITFSAPESGNVTWTGSSAMTVSGSFTAYTAMTKTYSGIITFDATTTGKTITFAGTWDSSTLDFNGSGGEWTFQDACSLGQITLEAGTLLTNNQTVTLSIAFICNLGSTRVLTLGSSTINLNGSAVQPLRFDTMSGSFTFNAGTSTFIFSSNTDCNIFLGNKTFYNLTLKNGANYITISLNDDATISNTLAITGINANAQRLFIDSTGIGTQRTLTANGTATFTNVDCECLVISGTAAPATGTSIGNCGTNSGITFTSPVTRFWVGNGGNIAATTHWSTSSGGSSGASFPLVQDTIVFNSSSFSSGGQNITVNVNSLRMSAMSFAGATNTPNLAMAVAGTNDLSMYGTLDMSSATKSGTATLNFRGPSTSIYQFNSNSQTFQKLNITIVNSGKLTLSSDLTITSSITVTSAHFDTGGKNIIAGSIDGTDSTGMILTLNSSLITLTDSGIPWSMNLNRTLNAGTSTIKLINSSVSTKTFVTGGKTYYNVWLTGSGIGAFIFFGNGTFNDLLVDTPPHTIKFTSGETFTFTTFTVSGTSGNLITIQSTTTASHTLVKAGGGRVSCDYLFIEYSTVNPAAYLGTWYAGANSVDNGNNLRWNFTAAPTQSFDQAILSMLSLG